MRKTELFQVTDEGRDKGKRFQITEMPALKAERWATRALLALAHSGAEVDTANGLAGVAVAGMKALHSLDFDEARPLLDEMWDCVKILPDPKNPGVSRPLMMNESEGDDIEELTTIWRLRERIFKLHVDFFFKGKA